MKKDDTPYLHHIREAIRNLKIATKNVSEADFVDNEFVREYSVRKLEVIGEAVKNISSDLKSKNNEIEWSKIAGTRDRLIHKYMAVDYGLVWSILKNDIPKLEKKINELIKD